MNKNWPIVNDFLEYLDEEEISLGSREDKVVSIMYAFYRYYNGDITKYDDLKSGITRSEKTNLGIDGIFLSIYGDDSVDFISSIDSDFYYGVFTADLEKCLKSLATLVAHTLIKTPYMDNSSAISICSLLKVMLVNENIYTIRILCDFEVPIEEKSQIQQRVTSYQVKNKNIKFEILFKDDIQQEIEDIANPKEYVSEGELTLTPGSSICFFGEEKSFISTISAKSLQAAYWKYGSKGLFDSNLRYYITSKKIDPKIINSIQNDSENFCYYNNGIIVTCDDYSINGNTISFKNFSVVNGGQTTNLIGRTEFEDDFPVICKVIRNKYEEKDKQIVFLLKVAEASNTQKPINAKDLIANRAEQRLLKIQFNQIGVFLKVKRGERIDKSIYTQGWQEASNDEIAQIIYSVVYQSPGSAKNSKSKLLSDEQTYSTIFGEKYDDGFFLTLQHMKAAYAIWLKRLKKEEKKTVKTALAQNASLMCYAAFGLMYKSKINSDVKKYLLGDHEINYTNEELKIYIQQNDIGLSKIAKNKVLNEENYNAFYAIFESIFGNILIPAYESFRRVFTLYSFSQFTKSDNYYYRFVIPEIIKKLKNGKVIDDILSETLSNKVKIDASILEKAKWLESKPGLEQELINYRHEVHTKSNQQIPSYEVITNRQIADVVKNLPKTPKDLARLGGLREEQIKKYGEAILAIINKYASVDNLV